MLIYCIAAIALMLSLCGLALDLGTFELTRIRMQNAADAAALGAVVASQSGGSIATAALQDAAQNGFTSGVGNVTVSVTNPPASGSYAGNVSAIQAIITKRVTGTFLPAKFTLTTQATALANAPPCVYLLSQYATQPSLTGINQNINVSCAFYLGSSYNFNGGSVSSGSKYYVAGASAASTGNVTPQPAFGAPVQRDPLASVAAPTFGACNYTNLNVTAATTLSPGVYCGGLTINTTGTVALQPGTYVIVGALNVARATFSGSGITFYLTQDRNYSYGASSLNNVAGSLSAPTSGNLQGLLVFADRGLPPGQATFTVQNFNAGTTMDGILYLPGQQLFASNATLQGPHYFGIVADDMRLNNSNFSPRTDYSSLAGGNPFQASGASAGLVE